MDSTLGFIVRLPQTTKQYLH